VDRDRAPPGAGPGHRRGDPRQLPRLRPARAGGRGTRPLPAVHVPPRRLERPGRPRGDGPHAARPGGPRGAGGRLPAVAPPVARGGGGLLVPGGRDQPLLHGALTDARRGQPGAGDRGTGRTGGDLGLAARLVRRHAGCPRQEAPTGPHSRTAGRSLVRRSAVRRSGRRRHRLDPASRDRAHRPARGAAEAAAPRAGRGRAGTVVSRAPRRARTDACRGGPPRRGAAFAVSPTWGPG
jgi:hypothetical protein